MPASRPPTPTADAMSWIAPQTGLKDEPTTRTQQPLRCRVQGAAVPSRIDGQQTEQQLTMGRREQDLSERVRQGTDGGGRGVEPLCKHGVAAPEQATDREPKYLVRWPDRAVFPQLTGHDCRLSPDAALVTGSQTAHTHTHKLESTRAHTHTHTHRLQATARRTRPPAASSDWTGDSQTSPPSARNARRHRRHRAATSGPAAAAGGSRKVSSSSPNT